MMIEIGGFLALAALIIGLFAWLKTDISSLRRETHRAFGELRRDMRQAISGRSAPERPRSPATITGETRNSRVNGLLDGTPGTVC